MHRRHPQRGVELGGVRRNHATGLEPDDRLLPGIGPAVHGPRIRPRRGAATHPIRQRPPACDRSRVGRGAGRHGVAAAHQPADVALGWTRAADSIVAIAVTLSIGQLPSVFSHSSSALRSRAASLVTVFWTCEARAYSLSPNAL